jgi:hypothetical protein
MREAISMHSEVRIPSSSVTCEEFVNCEDGPVPQPVSMQ